MTGLIVDSFAGGGGASLGIEMALGRSPDIAINHDREAIAMHAINHPETRHYVEDVWHVDPLEATGGRPVELAWFSPDCTHFSRAKGGKPVNRKRRALAWTVVRWAKAVRPRLICLENVAEFETWGPLDRETDRPRADAIGLTFRRWVRELRKLGYEVSWRTLKAHHYGAPTSRERLYLIASLDGAPAWPVPTHGPGMLPYRTAAECIDWSLDIPSIFDRSKTLAEATLKRIARGIRRYVIETDRPYIVGDAIAPTMVQTSYGEREGQAPRILDLHKPLTTVVAGGQKHALVAAFLARHYGGPNGNSNAGGQISMPFHTVTTQDHHALVTTRLDGVRRPEVRVFLDKYYGTSEGQQIQIPLGTVTTRDRFSVVSVEGRQYEITDIGMRLLVPRELFRAQGFPDSYVIDPVIDGRALSKTAQVRMCGNSVSPLVAAAIVRANIESARGTVAA